MAKSGLIPREFIDQVIEHVDIVDVVSKRIDLRHKGKSHLGLCPFHNEKTPSFTVSDDKQLYYCFGCGAGGNVINFIMAYDRLDFVEAIEQLAFQQGLEIPKTLAKDSEEVKKTENLYAILTQTAQFYRRQLRDHPAGDSAIRYLQQRQLTGDIAKQYGLGFSPPGWETLSKHYAASNQQALLIQTGMLIRKDNGKTVDRFRHRIMFPIRDMRGRVVGFGGRVLNPDDNPKYLNSPETAVFHKSKTLYGLYEARQQLTRLDRLVVVEGYMDVVGLAQHGFWGAVATLGTAVSSDHVKQMLRLVNTVIFCFDGDLAGQKAAERALEMSLPHVADNISIRFLFLPEGEDPDSLIQKEGKDAFENRVSKASSLSDYLFALLKRGLDLETIEGRAKIVSTAIPWLEKLPDNIFRKLFVQKLSEMTKVSASAIASQMDKKLAFQQASSTNYLPVENKGAPKNALSRQKTHAGIHLVHDLLKILVHKPDLALQIKQFDLLKSLSWEGIPLLTSLVDAVQNQPNVTMAKLLAQWVNTPEEAQLAPYLSAELLLSDEQIQQQFIDTIERLEAMAKEQQLEYLLKKAKRHELSSEEKQQLSFLLSTPPNT